MNEAYRTLATKALADYLFEWINEGDYSIWETSIPGDNYERIYLSHTPTRKDLRVTIEEV